MLNPPIITHLVANPVTLEDTVLTVITLAAAFLFVGGLVWIGYKALLDTHDEINDDAWWSAKMREHGMEAHELSAAELAEALRNHKGKVIVAIKKPNKTKIKDTPKT